MGGVDNDAGKAGTSGTVNVCEMVVWVAFRLLASGPCWVCRDPYCVHAASGLWDPGLMVIGRSVDAGTSAQPV